MTVATPETEPETVVLDERALQVFYWRVGHLDELGFTLRQARRLASRPDIVHDAAALLAQGCPVSDAFDILS